MVPAAVPVGANTACNLYGISAIRSGAGQDMAHELGHQLGYPHAPCGDVGAALTDPMYPAYEPYDTPPTRQASIGEYGIDVTTGGLYSPNTARDYMSYCPPAWTFLYHYLAQLREPNFAPGVVAEPEDPLPDWIGHHRLYQVDGPAHHAGDPALRELALHTPRPPSRPAVVVAAIRRHDAFDVRAVLRLDTHPDTGRTLPDSVLQLLDESGLVLAEGPVHEAAATGCGGCASGCCDDGNDPRAPRGVLAELPDTATGAALRLLVAGQEVWRRDRPAAEAEAPAPEVEQDDEGLSITWRAVPDPLDGAPTGSLAALRFSTDDDRTWQVLVPRLTERRVTVPRHVLPAGRLLVALLVSDGFHTAHSSAVPVEIPRRPPDAAVLWPRADFPVPAGHPVRLWAAATDCTGAHVPDSTIRWFLDGTEQPPGTDTWCTALDQPGTHRLRLTVDHPDGTTTVDVDLEV